MQTEFDWTFVKEFHPLPNRDRRLLLKAMRVTGISCLDERQFYGWLAERYRLGDGPLVDAAIQKTSSKHDERGLGARLYEWLIKRAPVPHPQGNDRAGLIQSMVNHVIEKGGRDALLLRALAANYPWLKFGSEPPDEALGAEQVRESAQRQDTRVETAMSSSVGDANATLERLIGAITALREWPDPTLLERAAALADAIELHATAAIHAERTNAELAQQREALMKKFEALDANLPVHLDAPSFELLTLEAVERIEASLLNLDDANLEFTKARDHARFAIDASKAERALANEALDRAEVARDSAIAHLANEIEQCKVQQADVQSVAKSATISFLPQAIGLSGSFHAVPPQVSSSNGGATEIAPRTHPSNTGVSDDVRQEGVFDAVAAQRRLEPLIVEPSPRAESGSAKPSQVSAVAFPADSDEPDPPDAPMTLFPTWDGWIASALSAGRYGLALHLANGRHKAGADSVESIAPGVLEGLLRGGAVQAAYGRGWAAYEDLKEPLLEATHATRTIQLETDLLLFAGAIRPALVQSTTGLAVLAAIEGEIAAALKPLRNVIERVAALRLGAIAEIAATSDREATRRRASELRAALAKWGENAPARKMNYQPATLVWQELLTPHGPLGRALDFALTGKPEAIAAVRALVSQLDEESDKAIDDAHANVSRGVRKDAIEGMARKHLNGHIANATELLRRWADAEEELGPREDRFHSYRDTLLTALVEARGRIRALTDADAGLEGAAKVFNTVTESVETQLRGTVAAVPNADEALDWEIALLPRFPLNARIGLRIEADDVEDLAAAAADAIRGAILSPESAFAQALALGAASSAGRLVDYLGGQQSDGATEALTRTIAQARADLLARKRALRRLLDDLQIATTAGSGELDELERSLTSFERLNIAELPRDVGERGSIADFPLANEELDRLERLIEKVRYPQRANLETRITALETLHNTTLDDCRAQLARGDLGTLSEEVDQIEKHGLAGPADTAPLVLLSKFTELLGRLGEKPGFPFGNLPRAARDGVAIGEFDFRLLTSLDRDRAETLLESWVALRRAFQQQARKIDPTQKVRESAGKVMAAIGWTDVQVKECERDTNWYKLSISTVALRSRDDCPVPIFGSERVPSNTVKAQYALVVAGPDDVDACIGSLERLPNPALLFITEALNSRQRRELQRKTRRGTLSIAVADAVTIAMLAMTPDARTRQFFDLAIPMGGAQPYADKGSETAIENFFGRERELKTLLDPRGDSFVYGGRQLGKTALLKQIELRQRDNSDQIAVYCFIKEAGDSQTVWEEIHSKLTARGLMLPKAATVPEQLKLWVEQKPGRYLLIMLDEADAFLESEIAANFPTIEQMKSLMADTQRGVKFVFAGLHNVQRFYRAPNSPLLHLGVPVNVGPLLGADRRAARQMALEPMAALGFAFEDKIDAYHMLSLIGFYPSLMQSFGKSVVTAMNERLGRSGEPDKMPIVIKRDIIDACFNEQTFRQGVLNRFQQTLQLDERYELITYAVWDRMQDDSQGGRSTALGYTAAEISKLAREWWSAGFAETDSLESFTAILDEMEEMGVLARKGDLYALRSQRIAAMLGGRNEIGTGLEALIDRAPRRRPDPLTSHRRIAKRWSPLTLRQEASLQKLLADPAGPKIVLLGATEGSGLAHLREAIDVLVTAPNVGWPKPRQLKSSFSSRIAEVAATLRRDAIADAPGLVVVEGVWPNPEELHALRKDRTFREAARPVRLILCGVPTAEVLAMPKVPELLTVLVGPLSMETLAHWMTREQFGFADDAQVQAALRDASGGWLECLEAMSLTAAVRKAGSDALIEAARASAAKLTLKDIGLTGDIASFARDLLREQGGKPVSENEMQEWATILGDEPDCQRLHLLRALGVIEIVPMHRGDAMLSFNPVAARLLS